METGVCQRQSLSQLIKQWILGLLLLMGAMISGCIPFIMTPTPVPPAAEAEDVRLIVQVQYPTADVLNGLAGELDIWEVDRTAQTFVARITLAQYEMLHQEALLVKLDCAKMEQYRAANGVVAAAVAELLAEQCPPK